MKKSVLYSIILTLMFLMCGVFYGCGGRYDNLSISAYFASEEYTSNEIGGGVTRYVKNTTVFDDNGNGSYTFYIQSNSTSTAPLKVDFAGAPDDFNYNASLRFSNELIVTPSETTRQTGNGVVRNLTFHSKGDTKIDVLSDEGEKETSLEVKVVEIASTVEFVKNNYALTKTNGSLINLSRDKALKVLPGDSSILKVSYAFGLKDGDDFTAFNDLELWGYGLNFDRVANILSVREKNDLSLKNFWIEATYENPLSVADAGEGQESEHKDIKAYTQVSVVNEVEQSSFEIFLGKSMEDTKAVDGDGKPINKINEGDVQSLINNITNLNYVDVVLKIKSNGEKVEFGIRDDGKLPITNPIFDEDYIEYANASNVKIYGAADEVYKNATYTYIFVKLVADKKTVENINYSQDGVYNLGFVCNYADYFVEGYPLNKAIDVKIYDLVKQFSVNNEKVENGTVVKNDGGAISFDDSFKDYYSALVYINTNNSLDGTLLNIDVFNPASILKEYSLFTVSLYGYVGEGGAEKVFSKISDVPNYFRIQKSVGSSTNKTNTTAGLTESFEKDTTFYIKTNETSGKIEINQTYYLVIEAILPNNEVFAGKDVEDQRAVATIELKVVQGLTSIENFDYSSSKYKVDETTGKFLRVDPQTGEELLYDEAKDKYYKLNNPANPDEESNRTYLEGELVVEPVGSEGVEFDLDTFVATEKVMLDLTSEFNADVTVKFLPAGANLDNLKIESSNNAVFEVEYVCDENGKIKLLGDNKDMFGFAIVPKGVGEAEVLISTSHLEQVYKIGVNVYKPITNMFVALSSTLWSNGVGTHNTVVDEKTQNKVVESAVVMVEKFIKLNISTLPLLTSDYTMQYSFYEFDGTNFSDAAAGSFERRYDGTTSSAFAYLQNDAWSFNCNTNVFVFNKNATQNDKILLVIKLINLDGTYFEREIELSSFVPVMTIDTTPNRDVTVVNPNTVAYELKTNDINDPSAFALKVNVNKNSQKATFDFENYGYIRILHNGKTETFEVNNGAIVQNNSNKILLPIRLTADLEGNFLFKLNPEYNYSKQYNSIVVIVEVKEFDNYFSKPIYVYVRNNTMVSSLVTSDETDLYFKQGLTPNKTFNFEIENEKADNKTVVAKTFNILRQGNEIYYVEALDGARNVVSPVELVSTSKSAYSFEVEPENAGEAVVVLMPQDKIISKAQYDTWRHYSYQTINVETGEFVENFYYIREGEDYKLATSYDENATYYIRVTQTSSYVSIWKDYLAVYITVADGETVPYQIFSLEDLEEISETYDSVAKNYVMVRNIILDTTHNWQPIGNYYVADVNEDNYVSGKYLLKIDSDFVVSTSEEFDETATYYLYGFDGKFDFKYTHVDIKQNVILENHYSLLNIAYAGALAQEVKEYGMFSRLGENAIVANAKLSYNFYQPKLSGLFSFGGVAGVNNGTILNAQIKFENFVFETVNETNIGGLVGVNNGFIDTNEYYVEKVDEDNYQQNKYYINLNNRFVLCEEVEFDENKTYYLRNVQKPVSAEGVIKVNVSYDGLEPCQVNIGGLVGLNASQVVGTFLQEGAMQPMFNDAGFDSSLNIVVDVLDGRTNNATTSIGGAVGRNKGNVKNVSIQGNISAELLDNVGGLVGVTEYSNEFNNIDEGKYSIEDSYSIAKVTGKNNVGGAIGSAIGEDGDKKVVVYNISAENYATVFNKNKTFVIGQENVGGLVGNSNFAQFEYCYSVSYFDNLALDVDKIGVDTSYDVIGNTYVGGFVGNTQNSTFNSASSSVYCLSKVGEVGIFAGNKDENSVGSNIFATGTVYSVDYSKIIVGLNLSGISDFAYYNYSMYNALGEQQNWVNYFDGTQFTLSGITSENIIEYFNSSVQSYQQDIANSVENSIYKWTEKWAIDTSAREEKINGGLPYLTLNGNALFATVPLLVESTVVEDPSFTTHIKNDNSSLILFYNYDYLNAYAEYSDRVQKLNLLSLNQFASLKVFAETYKSYRLDISVSGKGVLDILSDGTIKILGEGSEEIIISSKLNSKYQAKIYVVVKFGVNDINVYSNISFTTNLDNCDDENRIETLKSRNYSLYVEESYTRSLTENAADVYLSNAQLRSTNDIGVRFEISKTQVNALVANTENANSINDIFKFNGLSWQDAGDTDYLYVDVPKKQNVFISPIIAFEEPLTIRYIPYLLETFGSKTSTIYLQDFAGDFDFIVKKGATKIMIEGNKDNLFSLSQLQTQTFTVTLYTDYEDDALVEDFNNLIYESYTDNNIWDVINNSQINNQPGQSANELLTIVKSDLKRNYSDRDNKLLESISVTYTVNYKDKINAVNKDKIFRFYFRAESNTTVDLTVGIIILGQDKINQVYGTVYSSLTDFPQTPEKNKIIYNGTVGVLSLEVYPFFSNYDKLRVRYESSLNYPMLMTQLSYNITANTGDKLVYYPESGSVSDFNEHLWIEKSSGQDTYLLNDLGVYSYSKTYFISLLVSTFVPDNTKYTIYVDILNYTNDIIDTYTIDISTVAQPGISFGFDERTLGKDSKYYLPLNTVNKLNVDTFNYDGDIEWEVTSTSGFELTEEMKAVLTPYLDVDGNYYFKVMEYLGKDKSNIFNLNMLGHTLQIKGSIEDGRNAPKFGQNFFTVDVVVSLFTVLDVVVQNVVDGYLTLPVSSTTPLYAYVDAYYDKALTDSMDNWYVNSDTTQLKECLKACGYEVEDSFSNYITQLQNALSKARYSQEEEEEVKTSGVWFYSTEDGASSYLQSTKNYNSNTFGVELFNDYFAVYGRQIDKNTSLALKLSLAYSNSKKGDERVVGIPNVLGYNVSPTNTTYETTFNFDKDFVLNFVYKSDLIDAIPVSTAQEFLDMKAGFDYRLIADIELSGYTPNDTEIASFDGNNHTIYITSFAYNNDTKDAVSLGLFSSVSANTILYNVSVCYTNRVEVVDQKMQSITNGLLTVGLLSASTVTFGGITATNNGTLTNCKVFGAITINLNADINLGALGTGINGGLVAVNSATGYITNSKVVNFNLTCYGATGGVVQNNSGKIVATYLNNSSINNLSSDATGGFVHTNSGEIYECYSQGYRLSTDNDIRNTGAGISSKGIVAGFVYSNSNAINDCYSNIKLSSSRYIAGFVHEDTNNSIISRCYSICYKDRNDNAIVASPFFGTNDITKITVNGQLINCFFLKGTGTWIDNGTYVNSEQNKVPLGLTFDEFATHTSFTNYDLSLTYKTSRYADGTSYNYVDGYTWVIIEGKPVIVSSLVDTISERSYEGKTKKYSSNFNLFSVSTEVNAVLEVVVPGEFGENKERYYYYNNIDESGKIYANEENAKVPENLLYSVVVDYNAKTLTYTFDERELLGNQTSQLLTLVYEITLDGSNNITSKKVLYAEYGEVEKIILDVREETADGYVDDDNYRANDTIVIKYKQDSDLQIASIDYYVLESASYYYSSAVHGKSYGSGTRTNPQMVYDNVSFSTYLSSNTKGNFYRLIKDIDFEYNFTKTSYSNFQGALQGNYMVLSRISISYIKNVENSDGGKPEEEVSDSFGLFAKISTIEQIDYKDFEATIISNVKLDVVEVLSNTHKYVGALAGRIEAYGGGNIGRNVTLNNITVRGYNGNRAFVQGKNAVGGLIGFASDNVIIKDIVSSVSVNATEEMEVGSEAGKMLYIRGQNNLKYSYAGGVIGILDASTITDYSTLKNYNVNNVSVSGEVTVIGAIAGGAFGLIAEDSVVNYANILVKTSNTNFVKALSYAGGIAGENRGSIISSSITYGTLETYSSVQPGESNLVSTNFFYNGSSRNSVIAIGGIVGLNNGGTISNSLSSVDVRNVNANIAGGAVGRFIQGTMENVIATGSVMADSIVGGLVGTLNDREIVKTAGYAESAIQGHKETIFKNNVSANNWLIQDYSTYAQMIEDSKIVAGYIGLIAASSNSNGLDFVKFMGRSYFANALYTSRTSQNAKSYLKVAYYSNSFDNSSLIEQESIEVLTGVKGTADQGIQVVYPYSTREMYYENTLIGPYYAIKSLSNYPNYKDQVTNPFVRYVYEIKDSSGIININSLYKQIDLTDTTIWTNAGNVIEMPKEEAYTWLNQHFGNIYERSGDQFKVVTQINNEDGVGRNGRLYNYFYIPSDNLLIFETQSTYNANENDIVVCNAGDGSYELDIFNDGSNYQLRNISSIVVNGNEIKLNGVQFKLSTTLSFELNSDINFTLDNGVKVKALTLEAEHIDKDKDGKDVNIYKIKSITIKYAYNTTSDYITKVKNSTSDVNTDEYRLSVTTKNVIYKSFMNNGYWFVHENFLLNNDYQNAVKYLTNLENSQIYIWEDFKKFTGATDKITQSYASTIEITTPEELALFAYYVNNGQTYAGKTVRLISDIDLSGKYWKPIGINSTNSFQGTFDGQGHLIKYATVNEKVTDNNSLSQFAGVFGYTKNAIIKNLVVIGGDIEGNIAGGVVGFAEGNLVIENITNRNTVVGVKAAGGMVGFVGDRDGNISGSCSFKNSINYGEVDIKESGSYEVYVGGLVGATSNLNMAENVVNYGNINVFNLKNSYADINLSTKAKIYVGGIVGNVAKVSVTAQVVNRGNIHVTTNAHYLNVGGVIGINTAKNNTLKELKNFGDIDVYYNNSIIQNSLNSAKANIGGVVGSTQNNIESCGNEGTILLTISTTTYACLGVGGVVGSTNANVSKCYNSNNINILTVSSKTNMGVGGIVGLIETLLTDNNITRSITNCYNSGDIYCDGNATMFVGGIFGSACISNASSNTTVIVNKQTESLFNDHVSQRKNINIIENCLNIGYVNITTFRKAQNALGAIAGVNALLQQKSNYYLSDAAYSGTEIFTSVCTVDDQANESFLVFKSLSDEQTNVGEDLGAVARRSSSLKALDNCYLGWDFASANKVWLQAYDTWYPTLSGNESSSLWVDKQEIVYQEKGSYVVRTGEQFAYIASKINSGELDSNGITIKLGNSVDLSNRFWTPIGTKDHPFKGTFDGSNYVIRNLTIDGEILDREYLKDYNYGALFGYIIDATIKNVGLESTIIQNVKYAASLVCFAENSRIEKVYSDAGSSKHSQILAYDPTSYTIGAGGLVYSMTDCSPQDANNMQGGMYYSYNNISVVFGVGTNEYNAISYIGGLVGSLNNSLINNSYNSSKGIIKLNTIKTVDDISGYSIAGYADEQSMLFNVFNLAPISINGTPQSEHKKLFVIEKILNEVKIKETLEPIFENLDASGEIDLKTIWTNEYSLNEEDDSRYPFLRGLGKEWKNTESEGLKSYSYSNGETRRLENTLLSTTLSESNTMLKIENPSQGYVQSTTQKVYLISTSEELAWLATNVNNGSLSTLNCEFVLTNNINLTGRYWTPIGITSIYPFQGVFNFNGHVISGLTIDSNNLAYGGLFGYTSNAYICNGYIKNSFIKIASENPTTNVYVGTVVGKGYNTTIQNVSVTTNLAAFSNSATFVGGIIGSLTGTNDYIISNVIVNSVEDRYIDTELYSTYISELDNNMFVPSQISIGAFSTGGNVYCGGITGYMSGYHVSDINSKYLLNNATNNVNITAISLSNASTVFLGGILGHGLEEVTLNMVANNGNLKSFSTQYDILGGIVGYLYNGSVSNAYFGGYIEGTQDASHIRTYLGGIIGTLETEGSVRYVVNNGSINSNEDYKNNATVGGIIGRTIDHFFTADLMSAYNCTGSNPSEDIMFGYAVGFIEFSEGVKQAFGTERIEEEIAHSNLVFLTAVSAFDTTKSPACWQKQLESVKLITSHIYLNGCQTSFGYLETGLSDNGALVSNLDIELKYTGGQTWKNGDKIGFSIVDKKYNYFYLEIEVSGNTFNLKNLMYNAIATYNANVDNTIKIDILSGENIDTNKLSIVYVTMIEAEVNS